MDFLFPVKSGSISVSAIGMAAVEIGGQPLEFWFYLIGKLRYAGGNLPPIGHLCELNMSGHMRVE